MRFASAAVYACVVYASSSSRAMWSRDHARTRFASHLTPRFATMSATARAENVAAAIEAS